MKASLMLANGTKVELDGQPDEVQKLLTFFTDTSNRPKQNGGHSPRTASRSHNPSETEEEAASEIDVVNWLKDEGAASWIDVILDSRDVTKRVLLPLYALHKMGIPNGVTSGFISRTLAQLGVRISVPNTSRELAGKAKRYVLASSVRRKGAAVQYTISRAGVVHMESGHGS